MRWAGGSEIHKAPLWPWAAAVSAPSPWLMPFWLLAPAPVVAWAVVVALAAAFVLLVDASKIWGTWWSRYRAMLSVDGVS